MGQNGYARGFAMTTSAYLIELDDDVVNAPAQWDAILLDAYRRLPRSGSWRPTSRTTRTTWPRSYRYRIRPHEYTPWSATAFGCSTGRPVVVAP